MFEDPGFLLWTNTFSDPAFVTQPSLGLLATECCYNVCMSARGSAQTNKRKQANSKVSFYYFPSLPVTLAFYRCHKPFDFISACERRGQERAWKKRRDSSLTRFPGPCCRLCSPLIGWRGCGTHSSSVSGFISGFYQHLDKQLLHRQSQITGQQRDIVQITSFKHFSS